jgi:hypothetical protein
MSDGRRRDVTFDGRGRRGRGRRRGRGGNQTIALSISSFLIETTPGSNAVSDSSCKVFAALGSDVGIGTVARAAAARRAAEVIFDMRTGYIRALQPCRNAS